MIGMYDQITRDVKNHLSRFEESGVLYGTDESIVEIIEGGQRADNL